MPQGLGYPPGQGPQQGQQGQQAPAQSGLVQMAKQRMQALPPKAKAKVQQLLTPDLAAVVGLLAGKELGGFIAQQANQENMLRPIPKKVLAFMGEEKFNKLIESAMIKAEEMEAAQAEQGQQAPPAGPAAPAPQQAPVNASAPTGQGGFAAGRGLPGGSAQAQIVNTPTA